MLGEVRPYGQPFDILLAVPSILTHHSKLGTLLLKTKDQVVAKLPITLRWTHHIL